MVHPSELGAWQVAINPHFLTEPGRADDEVEREIAEGGHQPVQVEASRKRSPNRNGEEREDCQILSDIPKPLWGIGSEGLRLP